MMANKHVENSFSFVIQPYRVLKYNDTLDRIFQTVHTEKHVKGRMDIEIFQRVFDINRYFLSILSPQGRDPNFNLEERIREFVQYSILEYINNIEEFRTKAEFKEMYQTFVVLFRQRRYEEAMKLSMNNLYRIISANKEAVPFLIKILDGTREKLCNLFIEWMDPLEDANLVQIRETFKDRIKNQQFECGLDYLTENYSVLRHHVPEYLFEYINVKPNDNSNFYEILINSLSNLKIDQYMGFLDKYFDEIREHCPATMSAFEKHYTDLENCTSPKKKLPLIMKLNVLFPSYTVNIFLSIINLMYVLHSDLPAEQMNEITMHIHLAAIQRAVLHVEGDNVSINTIYNALKGPRANCSSLDDKVKYLQRKVASNGSVLSIYNTVFMKDKFMPHKLDLGNIFNETYHQKCASVYEMYKSKPENVAAIRNQWMGHLPQEYLDFVPYIITLNYPPQDRAKVQLLNIFNSEGHEKIMSKIDPVIEWIESCYSLKTSTSTKEKRQKLVKYAPKIFEFIVLPTPFNRYFNTSLNDYEESKCTITKLMKILLQKFI